MRMPALHRVPGLRPGHDFTDGGPRRRVVGGPLRRRDVAAPSYARPMTPLPPTSRTVAAAVEHYRELRGLTRDELARLLHHNGHELDVDDIRGIEQRLTSATVDDLTAIACALDTSPAELLSHISVDQPAPEGPAATGVPDNVCPAKHRDWLLGATSLDVDSRLDWHRSLVTGLRMRSVHIEDQLRGAQQELEDLGELAVREADMPPVQRLHARIDDGEQQLSQTDLALATAEQRLQDLQHAAGRAADS